MPNVCLAGYQSHIKLELLSTTATRLWSAHTHDKELFLLLPGVEPLTWDERLRIAAAAAQGIKYLHEDCSPSFIHRWVLAESLRE